MKRSCVLALGLLWLLNSCASSRAPEYVLQDQGDSAPDLQDMTAPATDLDSFVREGSTEFPDGPGSAADLDCGAPDYALDMAPPDLAPDMLTPDQPDPCVGKTCSDGLACTADACKAGTCSHQLKPGFCIISGACYKQGAAHPTQSCYQCLPGKSNTSWSKAQDGAACKGDAFTCTRDVCSGGACTHPLKSGWCKIGNICYAAGAKHPTLTCQGCAPGKSTSSWSASADGAQCKSDGVVCTNDACKGGACTHTLMGSYCRINGVCYTSGTQQPGHMCGRCNPGLSQSSWSNAPNGAPCQSDNLVCTQDVCQGGSCAHPVAPSYCKINGACYTHGSTPPGGGCNFCNATKNKLGWTPITYAGCCAGQNLYFCNSGSLSYLDCSVNPSCGWDSFNQYYNCGTSGGTGPQPKSCF